MKCIKKIDWKWIGGLVAGMLLGYFAIAGILFLVKLLQY